MLRTILKIVIVILLTIVVLVLAFILFVGFMFREDTSETEKAQKEYQSVILPALSTYFDNNNKYPDKLEEVVKENSLKYTYSYRVENADGQYGGPACTYEITYVFQSVGLNNFRDLVDDENEIDRCYDQDYLELYNSYKLQQSNE